MTPVSSDWFVRHRQEFIRDHIRTFGIIRRQDIADRFELTVQIASSDIARFIDAHPGALVYDGKAKMYVLDKEIFE